MAALFEFRSPRTGLPPMTSVPDVPDASTHDDALVRAAQVGDRSAFGLLYSRYARMVHGILLTRVPPAEAEDLVHDVFLQALPRLASLREISKFPGWLAAIARNRATDFHRRVKDEMPLDDEFTSGDRDPALSHPRDRQAAQAASEAHAVLAAIRSLPDAYREPLLLRLVEGMTGPEIAARTGLTHGSVRVNLHRGMQQLREILGQRTTPAASGEL